MEDSEIIAIAQKRGVGKVHIVAPGDAWCETNGYDKYHNNCWSCGTAKKPPGCEIWVGIYDDANVRLASFFHELARVCVDWDGYFKNAPKRDKDTRGEHRAISHSDVDLACWIEGVHIGVSEGFFPDGSTWKACMETLFKRTWE